MGACAGADQVPAILVARDDLAGVQHDDMGIRQKVEGRRRAGAGGEHQRAGLGHRGEARGQRHGILRLGSAAPDAQQGARVPRDHVEARIRRRDQLGRQILGREIARHLGRDVLLR